MPCHVRISYLPKRDISKAQTTVIFSVVYTFLSFIQAFLSLWTANISKSLHQTAESVS